jgi:hypothetical protein
MLRSVAYGLWQNGSTRRFCQAFNVPDGARRKAKPADNFDGQLLEIDFQWSFLIEQSQ